MEVDMREIMLLRWSQAGIVLCGLALIAVGSGIRIPSLTTLVVIALSGVVAGVIYESKLHRRGEGEGLLAVLLPLIGGMSGVYALVASV
jgi:hypothetical protein